MCVPIAMQPTNNLASTKKKSYDVLRSLQRGLVKATTSSARRMATKTAIRSDRGTRDGARDAVCSHGSLPERHGELARIAMNGIHNSLEARKKTRWQRGASKGHDERESFGAPLP